MVLLTIWLLFALVKVQKANVNNTSLAQTNIESLYQDNAQVLLREDVNQEDIEKLKDKVLRINSWNKGNLLRQIDLIQDKYDATDQLSSLYQTDAPLNLAENIIDQVPLKYETNTRLLESLEHNKAYVRDAAFNEVLNQHYDNIQQMLTRLSEAEELANGLAIHYDKQTMEESVERYIAVEDRVAPYKHQPQSQTILKKLNHNGRLYCQDILNNISDIQSNDPVTKKLFDVEVFDEDLTGTEIDTRPLVALTFDDGPSDYTETILEILDKHEIKAMFFQLGRYIELKPEVTKLVADRGHRLGNHSYSHANFDVLNNTLIREEINRTQELIQEVTGKESTTYRTPYGNGRATMLEMYPNLTPIYWNVDSEDWITNDAEATIDHVLDNLEHRSIILMHDSLESTAQALEQLILELKVRGYVFVTPEKIPEADSYVELN